MSLTDANSEYRIGPYGFLLLQGQSGDNPPEQTVSQSQPIARIGVDGIAVRRQGLIPRPFTMVSFRDIAGASPTAAFATARALLAAYDTTAQLGPVQMYYGGVLWGTYSILNVATVSIQAVQSNVGGFHGSAAGAVMAVRWELVAVQ